MTHPTDTNTSRHLAFIGMGAMGRRMVRHLLPQPDADEEAHRMTLGTRTPNSSVAQTLLGFVDGAVDVAAPNAATDAADVVFSMVTDDDASRAMWLGTDGTDGALASLKPGALVVECSTLSPSWVRALQAEVRARNARFVDAPLAGSTIQAEAAALVFVVGGTVSDVDEVRPWLLRMGQAVHHVGDVGQGAVMKLAINQLFTSQAALLAETLRWCQAQGMNSDDALAVLAQTPVLSKGAQALGRGMLHGTHVPGFPVRLVEKDLRYFLDAQSEATAAPVTEAAHATFADALQAGKGGRHLTVVGADLSSTTDAAAS